MASFKGIREVFTIFQNKESYFDEINRDQSNRLIVNQLLIICCFAFFYGVVMGCSHSLLQSVVAGLKVIVLFLSTVIICFPSFFIIQQVFFYTNMLKHQYGHVNTTFHLCKGGEKTFLGELHVAVITGS